MVETGACSVKQMIAWTFEMGFIVSVKCATPITEEMLIEFEKSVVEYKRYRTYLEDFLTIVVVGSYEQSNTQVNSHRSFVERMIRWFGKVKGVRCSANYVY